jgi:alcohol dehydrogenase (NADP+)
MIHSTGYAAHSPKEALKLYEFERREPAENEVLIDIHYCGICHADIDMKELKNKLSKPTYA